VYISGTKCLKMAEPMLELAGREAHPHPQHCCHSYNKNVSILQALFEYHLHLHIIKLDPSITITI
jgi:hypothetical protein